MTSTLTFDATVSTQVAVVPILDDNVVEDSEFVNVTLVSADHAAMFNPTTTRITIEDTDSESTTCTMVFNLHSNYISSISQNTNGTNKVSEIARGNLYYHFFHDFSCAGWI